MTHLANEPIHYPVLLKSYHPRWYGRFLIRLSQWALDLAYWRGREVMLLVNERGMTTSESTDGGMTWKPR